ncbi:MAG: hypothetical protein ACFFAS_11150 [Promethearchaeota archaeon]
MEIARQKREFDSSQIDIGRQLPKKDKIFNEDFLDNTRFKTSNLFIKEKIEANNSILSDLLRNETKLTFLIGAGCSTDAPSYLPTARSMMDAIIQYACLESEIKVFKRNHIVVLDI